MTDYSRTICARCHTGVNLIHLKFSSLSLQDAKYVVPLRIEPKSRFVKQVYQPRP